MRNFKIFTTPAIAAMCLLSVGFLSSCEEIAKQNDKDCWEDIKYGRLQSELMRLQSDFIKYTDLYIHEKNLEKKMLYYDTADRISIRSDEVYFIMYGGKKNY